MTTKQTELTSLARNTIAYWFAHRNDNKFSRDMARAVIKDAQLWLLLFKGKGK